MYPVSVDFHTLATADSPQTRCRIYFIPDTVDCTDDNDVITNGTLLKYENADTDSDRRIADTGVTFNDMFNSDRNIVVGGTVSKQVHISMINLDGGLNGFEFGRCKVFVDVYDATNATWLPCPMGVYLIEQPTKTTTKIVNASGYDQMQYLNKVADAWWSNIDWSGGVTVSTLISQIASECGVSVSANLSGHILNGSNAYYEAPLTANQTTYRDILGWLGGVTGTIGYFDRDGALDMRWFKYATDETDTYSGNPVQFTGGSGDSISSLTIPLTPTQDLHGYANPWPAGGGVNKLPNLRNVASNRVTLGQTQAYSTLTIPLTAGTYTVSVTHTLANACYMYERHDGTNTSLGLTTAGGGTDSYTFTVSSDTNYSFSVYRSGGVDSDDITQFWLVSGSDAGTYTPYENICPITGLTGLSVYRAGKNLIDPSKKAIVSGSNTTARWYNDGTGLLLHSGQAYTLSANVSTDATYFVYIYSIGGTQLAYGKWTATYTPSADIYVYFQYYESGGAHLSDAELQLELGSATAYEPYNGNTYSVDWSTQAGTVYGGTLDVVTGVLTVDKAALTLNTANVTNDTYPGWREVSGLRDITGAGLNGSVTGITDFTGATIRVNTLNTNNTIFFYKADLGLTATELQANMPNTDVHFLLSLATPLTYQLTAQEVEVLVGTNNVWSDAGSTITLAVDRAVTIDSDTLGNGVMALDLAEYTVTRIDMLEVLPSNADLTTAVGEGGNVYQIAGNPFLVGADDDAVNALATPIYNRLATVRLYFPMTIRLITDWSLESGDVIKVINGGKNYVLPIMQQTMTWRGGFVLAEMLSSGDPARLPMDWEERTAYQNDVQMHEFENTVNMLRSQIRDLTGNYSLIQQTVDSITNIVSGQGQTIQSILDPTGQIWTAITTNSTSLTTLESALNSEISTRQSYIRFIPAEPAIVLGVDTGNEIKLKLVNNIIYFFNGADDSTDLSLAYAYFNNEEAGADRFVAKESVQIGNADTANMWLFKVLANGDLILDVI